MAYSHITASGAVNIAKDRIRAMKITVNGALTGTITVSDEVATAGTPVVAVITNPTVGTVYEYWDFKNGVTINPSATCDITCNADSSFGPH